MLFLFVQDHFNFFATDEKLGPILLSVKSETVAGHEHWRLILRLRTGTAHELVPISCLPFVNGPSQPNSVTNGAPPAKENLSFPARLAKVCFACLYF